ncbi:FAD-binding oxidoreductase [Nakamurella antarctica]|uniref:FAD-binding oxidoreductase n=1 Tax=Nakamurella antarctica TaxID=1902245 RepID=A0A3G8ZPI5_9ACTN|nr:FAD-binding oxidoreductase [Nakamurella antarctica]AZI59252.1 FAD-binding oxidoreductase [Nakamurella antarctica]
MTSPAIIADLTAIVGADHVLTDQDVTAAYVTDWTGRFSAASGTVVRPSCTAEVAAVVGLCASTGTAVVPQGGNTGLVGGGVPHRGEVVLSLRRLAAPPEVDVDSSQVLAQAGVTIAALRTAANAHGMTYGVDLASRDSATVGGTIGTNAGGLRVLRHGDTRRQVIGVEAVLGDGTIISHLDGLTRDNTGYHLPSLLTGSEGTLAIVTAARLRLVPAFRQTAVALLAMTDVEAAVKAAGTFRRELAGVSAVELVLPAGMELVTAALGLRPAFSGSGDEHGAYLLVECDGSEPLAELMRVVETVAGVQDAAAADDAAGRAALWAYRERQAEAIATVGSPIKLDVTLPMHSMPQFLRESPAAVSAISPDARVWTFGHIADGNAHVNVTGGLGHAHAVEDAVLQLVARLGGSIASEHGVGVAKKDWLRLNRSPAELALFRAIKAAFDPAGILNPNAVLPH